MLGLALAGYTACGAHDMTSLVQLEPVTLGVAAAGAESWCTLTHVAGRWSVVWSGPDHVPLRTSVAIGLREQSTPVPAPELPASARGAADPNALAKLTEGDVTLLVRSGHRIPGAPPRFPSAGLIISREQGGARVDLAFVDGLPDRVVGAAALALARGRVAAVYLTVDEDERAVCRLVEMPLPAAAVAVSSWRKLPAYPESIGVAGVLAGVHQQVLIAAGGANFPDKAPWEGGAKVTHDTIHVLRPGADVWESVGRLPEPRSYGAAVSVPQGVLVIGGENGTTIYQDAFFLVWDSGRVRVEPAPGLAAPVTSPVAAVLGTQVYLAGGYAPGAFRTSRSDFWRLDLERLGDGWQREPSWPGPSRAQAVMAAVDGAVYLLSGLELVAGADGKARAAYLADAYRFRPGEGWSRLPDLPWSALAAPSPAPVNEAPARLFVLGGVDGRQAGKLPRDARLPEDILVFDVAANCWKLWPEPWPQPVVTSSAVLFDGAWTIVSGETMAGVRTPEVWSWMLPPTPSAATVAEQTHTSP